MKGSLSARASIWPQTKAGKEAATNSRFKGPQQCKFYSKEEGTAAAGGQCFSFKCPAAASEHVFVSVQFFCQETATAAAPSPPIEIPAVVRALFREGERGTAENGSRTRKPFL